MNAAELGLVLTEERVVVSSRDVARNFEKEHKDVLRAIKSLECSQEFGQRNFAPSSYLSDQNKEMPEYLITRDGFAFLAMGFTGKKAARFKEAYITAFNEMEWAIRAKRCPVESLPAEKVFRWKDTQEAIGAGHYVRPLVNDFVSYCCETVPHYLTSRQDYYYLLLQYCAIYNLLPPTRCAAVRAMNDLAYFREYRSCGERYWKGLRILPPQMWRR